MRVIELYASGWGTVLDFMGALREAIGAREGHGWSPDAFVDSMIWGGINALEPPYEIRVVGADALPTEVRDYVFLMSEILMRARADHHVRKGHDVNVTLSVSRHSSN